ncbi:MAG: cytochrome c oxidase subunit II [Gammaproteobacteria bacterium]|nr:MAG: cytochrome c oxidase subunit II [Gammaproteobacteria bacterium]PCJ19698.1 MAG: cytochrome c oxidase subunit II [Gammaproteobacteria bacterium]
MYLSTNQLKKRRFPAAALALSTLSTGAIADPSSRWQTNLSPGVTELGQEVFDLHMLVVWICVAISVAVFGVLLYVLINHTKASGRTPATFHESTVVELMWTIVPALILIAIAVPATNTLIKLYDSSDSDVDILVTGYQWKWKYEYLSKDGGETFSFLSILSTPADQFEIGATAEKGENYLLEVDEPLVIPVNKKVRFLVTSADVLHAWWVPALSVKRDAVPGYINDAWTIPQKEGIYRGQCAELCGKDHGFMPIVVKVVSEKEYEEWVASKLSSSKADLTEKSLDELVASGEALYNKNCSGCHAVNGTGIPGVFPALKGSSIALGDVNAHIDVVVNGAPGTAMSAYGAQIKPDELAAIITYERNAWGNNTGDAVQASDIVNFNQ